MGIPSPVRPVPVFVQVPVFQSGMERYVRTNPVPPYDTGSGSRPLSMYPYGVGRYLDKYWQSSKRRLTDRRLQTGTVQTDRQKRKDRRGHSPISRNTMLDSITNLIFNIITKRHHHPSSSSSSSSSHHRHHHYHHHTLAPRQSIMHSNLPT